VEELIAVATDEARPAGGSRLDAILAADAARERALRSRDGLIALLAALGLPLWAAAVWPAAMSRGLRALAASAWAIAAAGVAVALLRGWWWRRVRSDRIAALGPLPRLRTPPARGHACAPPLDGED